MSHSIFIAGRARLATISDTNDAEIVAQQARAAIYSEAPSTPCQGHCIKK
jgi:hypothetical protein